MNRRRRPLPRPSLIGEAQEPLTGDDAESMFVRAAEGEFASRVYRYFLVFSKGCFIAPHIRGIARLLRADEDCVWDLFVQYMRGADEPWRA